MHPIQRMKFAPWLVSSALLPSCVGAAEPERAVSSVSIPGRWIAPAATQSIAATQHVPVVDPPAVSPLGRCTSSNAFACSCAHPACMSALPGTRELDAYLRRRFSFLRAGGTYCCRQNSATTSVPRLSVHSLGRAIDLMVPMHQGDADNTLGDQVANWLVENAEHVGVQRVVWDRSYWNGERGFGPLGANSLSHTDHIHVELGLDGAARRTPFFTSGASTGSSCAPRCEGTRVIQADCSAVECAAMGAACVPSPPRCGSALPPEATESTRVSAAPRPTLRAITEPLRVSYLSPSRRFDTRSDPESTRLVRRGVTGPLQADDTATLRDWRGAGLPIDARAVWMNLTAISPLAPGFLTAWPEGAPRPETSSLNFLAGEARANAALVTLGADDGVALSSNTALHLVGDLTAAFAPAGDGLNLIAPTRVYDSRSTTIALRGNEIREIDARAPAGVTGVIGTLTAVARGEAGFLQVFSCASPPPASSAVNFAANAVASNAFVTPLDRGRLCLRALVDTDVVVDLSAHLAPSGALAYRALAPQRILDTRGATTPYTGRLAARQVIELAIQSLPGAPANVGAAVMNVTAVGASAPGFLSVFPCGGAVPASSSLNFVAETARSTLVTAGVGDGAVCVFASERTQLVVDLFGVWVAASPPVTPSPEPDPGDDGDDLPEAIDAGVAPADAVSAGDAGAPIVDAIAGFDAAGFDGGLAVDEPTQGGCACRAPRGLRGRSPWLLAALLLASRRRRVHSRDG